LTTQRQEDEVVRRMPRNSAVSEVRGTLVAPGGQDSSNIEVGLVFGGRLGVPRSDPLRPKRQEATIRNRLTCEVAWPCCGSSVTRHQGGEKPWPRRKKLGRKLAERPVGYCEARAPRRTPRAPPEAHSRSVLTGRAEARDRSPAARALDAVGWQNLWGANIPSVSRH